MPHLDIVSLSSRYGAESVLKDVSLAADQGEVLTVIGPSGSGKSTLLRVLIGLTPPSGGEVFVAGERVDYGSRRSLRTLREKMSIVFQEYNLFQNMTVVRNITVAPLKIKKRPREQVNGRRRHCWKRWAWRTSAMLTPRNFRAVSSSVWPSPARSPPGRRSCCSTR